MSRIVLVLRGRDPFGQQHNMERIALLAFDLYSYYGMPRKQIHINLPPEHPIMSFETIEMKMAARICSCNFGSFAQSQK